MSNPKEYLFRSSRGNCHRLLAIPLINISLQGANQPTVKATAKLRIISNSEGHLPKALLTKKRITNHQQFQSKSQ